MARAGFDFEILKADFAGVEPDPARANGGEAADFARTAAEAKLDAALVCAAAAGAAPSIIICADTVVSSGGRIFGKPADAADARRMLSELSGGEHEVHTGVALGDTDGASRQSFVETTRVLFEPLSDEQIEAYIRTGEPFDKAGAYGIQDKAGVFVAGVRGCFANVVGLPVARLAMVLKEKFGVHVADYW